RRSRPHHDQTSPGLRRNGARNERRHDALAARRRLKGRLTMSRRVQSETMSISRMLMASLLAALIGLGGCATRPVNPPITKVDLNTGYTYQTRQKHFRSQENLVVLAFSGGRSEERRVGKDDRSGW